MGDYNGRRYPDPFGDNAELRCEKRSFKPAVLSRKICPPLFPTDIHQCNGTKEKKKDERTDDDVS